MTETQFCTIIADILYGIACDFLSVDGLEVPACNFTHIDHHVEPGHGFAGHAAFRTLFQSGIQDGIRYLITQFVWLPLSDGFRGEYMRSSDLAHDCLFLVIDYILSMAG